MTIDRPSIINRYIKDNTPKSIKTPKKIKHIHKYHRLKLTFGTVWACASPDCNHFMPVHLEDLVIGRQSICWNCGSVTTVKSKSEEKPVHSICSIRE